MPSWINALDAQNDRSPSIARFDRLDPDSISGNLQGLSFMDLRMSVLVVMPAPIPCIERDHATLSGEFDKEGFGGPMLLWAHILSCGV